MLLTNVTIWKFNKNFTVICHYTTSPFLILSFVTPPFLPILILSFVPPSFLPVLILSFVTTSFLHIHICHMPLRHFSVFFCHLSILHLFLSLFCHLSILQFFLFLFCRLSLHHFSKFLSVICHSTSSPSLILPSAFNTTRSFSFWVSRVLGSPWIDFRWSVNLGGGKNYHLILII